MTRSVSNSEKLRVAQLGGRLVEYSDILSGKKVKLTGIISVLIYKREDCDRVSLVSLFFFFREKVPVSST